MDPPSLFLAPHALCLRAHTVCTCKKGHCFPILLKKVENSFDFFHFVRIKHRRAVSSLKARPFLTVTRLQTRKTNLSKLRREGGGGNHKTTNMKIAKTVASPNSALFDRFFSISLQGVLLHPDGEVRETGPERGHHQPGRYPHRRRLGGLQGPQPALQQEQPHRGELAHESIYCSLFVYISSFRRRHRRSVHRFLRCRLVTCLSSGSFPFQYLRMR